ncbi:putative penicillin-binding protein [Xylogone sp. PMI_703]|nr:putative penicillin-binding protein [Xylogone sp. PMI_703]
MSDFDDVLAEITARGADGIPGCVLAAVDRSGDVFISKSAGYNSVAPDAKPLDPDATFWIASCTKLVTAIAALQCVERGQISLDEPIDHILPELANPEIILAVPESGGSLKTSPATMKITLRNLLSHNSGIAYDMFNPQLVAWRAARGEAPLGLSGRVVDAYNVPLLFEPGEGWAYGGGIDWAGEIVARLNKITLEEYFQKHILGPLGMKSTTFRLEKHPEIKQRLMSMTGRTDDGGLKEITRSWPDFAPEDCGGGGLYSSVPDYLRLIGDLIKDKPILLQLDTIKRELFTPQFDRGSASLKGLIEAADTVSAMTGVKGVNEHVNWTLGGLYIQEDIGSLKRGTLAWGGLPNLSWFIDPEYRIAALCAGQLMPPGDEKSIRIAQRFLEEVWLCKDI